MTNQDAYSFFRAANITIKRQFDAAGHPPMINRIFKKWFFGEWAFDQIMTGWRIIRIMMDGYEKKKKKPKSRL